VCEHLPGVDDVALLDSGVWTCVGTPSDENGTFTRAAPWSAPSPADTSRPPGQGHGPYVANAHEIILPLGVDPGWKWFLPGIQV
jgi:hypothetical protein